MLTSSDYRVLMAQGPLRPPPWASPNDQLRAEFAPRFRAWVYNMAIYSSFPSFVSAGHASFARPSPAYWDGEGAAAWQQFASGAIRQIDGVGVILEQAATNQVENNSMQGAGAGTPGTLPTGWTVLQASGLATNVIGTGTEDGIEYIDLQIIGTAVGTAWQIAAHGTNAVAAAGQQWVASGFFALSGGSMANITATEIRVVEENTGAFLAASETAFPLQAAALGTQRASVSRLFSNGSTTNARWRLRLTFADGAAINVTVRIGWPQLERDRLSTPIRTAAAPATRAADQLTLNLPASGQFDLNLIFDNDSQQAINGISGAYLIDPAAIDRPAIKSITAVAA